MGQNSTRIALITGGNRGIGFELVRQLSQKGWHVYAGMRAPERSAELIALAESEGPTVTPITLEVTNEDHIAAAVETIAGRHERLDLLLNNAADYGHNEEGVQQTRAQEMLRVLAVNSVAPIILARHCLPLLVAAGEQGGKPVVATVSSGAGLLRRELPPPASQYSYHASKAALNIYLMRLAADLREQGITSIGLSPGFVLTDMTRAAGLSPSLLPEESAGGLIRVLERVTRQDAGRFFRHSGEELDWAVAD
jgi:NAD(P)-dependent dehydrogenase (short-subunit alcohol dehydrogenase family)